MRTPTHDVHVFLPSFVEIRKAEVTKTMRGNSLQNKMVGLYSPFLQRPMSEFAENFTGSTFSRSPFLYQVLSKSIRFRERYTRKCRLELLFHGRTRTAYRCVWSCIRGR